MTLVGDTSSRLSMRSSIPPWPGIRCPESFTFSVRFSNDSTRSPQVENIDTHTPSNIHSVGFKLPNVLPQK